MKTYLEQVTELKATREKVLEQIKQIASKPMEEGRSTDSAEEDQIKELRGNVTKLDSDIKLYSDLAEMDKATAKPIGEGDQQHKGVIGQGGYKPAQSIIVKDNRVRGEGIAMAQVAKLLFKAKGNIDIALNHASADQRIDPRVQNVLKAAVAAGSTSNETWVGNLVGDETSVYADFVEYLRPRTIIGRFGNDGIPSLRRVPFRVPLIGQSSGGAGYWVGEGNAKPLTKFDFSRTTMQPLKVANIAILTMEAVRDSSPSADALVRDQLVAALAERMDIDFIDPDKAAGTDSPASITNGVAEISSTGSDADAIRADVRALWAPFIAANNAPTTAVYIMSATTALALSLMQNALGQSEFPGITINGGTFLGIPVIVSEHLANNGGSAGGVVALVNANDIYFSDEGGFQVDLSMEASVQMDDAPDNPSSASTVLVSLWQRNLVGFRAERTVNWARRRTGSVSWLGSVSWGQ
jgi:HK97 family phage major capsid protein